MCLAISNDLLLVLQDAPKHIFFLRTRDLLVSQKTTQRHFFLLLHPPSPFHGNFATATVLAFVLLPDSRFNFHCYTQRKRLLKNRPGSALRLLTTSCAKDYKAHSLQETSFAESPNRAILRSLFSALSSHLILHECTFLNIHRSGVLTALAWLVPH